MPADNISKGLHSFLVRLSYTPESVSGDIVHAMEHIMHLLTPEDEHAVTGYYGLFGIERIALDEIAASRGYDMKKLASTGQNSMSASLELKPMCARLEIAKITPGPDIIQYKVDGIYLAGFYSQMYISQISNRDFWTGPEYDTENAAEELNRFYTQYPYLKNEDIRGVAETVNVTNEDGSEGTKEIKVFYPNDEGKVWAYPFFGKYEARDDNDHYGLRLIVKVSDLIVNLKDENGVMQRLDVTANDLKNNVPAEKAGIRYLNINGFVEDYHNTEAEPIQFYNGNVYTVQNFDITTQNLSDKIMPNDISVNVTLTVKPWTIKKVYPQI